MERNISGVFKALKSKLQTKIRQVGMRDFLVKIAVFIVVVFAVGNLAFSQVHIGVIVKVFNRIVGLTMFGFILFGLVSLFAVTRLTAERNTILRALLSLVVTSALGITYITILLRDVATQESVTYFLIYNSFITAVVIVVGYLIAALLLVIGEFVYANK